MKRLKQEPTIIPYRMGKVSVGGKEFKPEYGNQGRTLLSQILVNDSELSPRIAGDKVLNALREYVLTQTFYTVDPKTGLRVVPNSTQFFGGSVYSFDKTSEGFYLCVFRDTDKSGDGEPHPSDRIGGVLVMSLDSVTEDGIKLLDAEGLVVNGSEYVVADTVVVAKAADTFNPDVRTMDDGAVMAKINDIMADKMAGKVKKVSKPL